MPEGPEAGSGPAAPGGPEGEQQFAPEHEAGLHEDSGEEEGSTPQAPTGPGEGQGADEGGLTEDQKRIQEGRISEDTFENMLGRVLSDRGMQGKDKAIETAREVGLKEDQIGLLRADRTEYAKARSESIVKAFDAADELVSEALRRGSASQELPATRGPYSSEPGPDDIVWAVRDRLYEEEKGARVRVAVAEGEEDTADPMGTPKVPGLSASTENVENSNKKQIVVTWRPGAKRA